jgi:hypothetical protein
VVRVRENYQPGLLIGNDSKMNGRLNSEGASRKTLRTVHFQGRVAMPVLKHTFDPLWLVGVLPRESSQTLCLPSSRPGSRPSYDLVHDLNQAMRDVDESGALELRADLR